ncbi:hypothetical protein PMAYCL1PPCAC_10305, partial [Pristionchus mayeri]
TINNCLHIKGWSPAFIIFFFCFSPNILKTLQDPIRRPDSHLSMEAETYEVGLTRLRSSVRPEVCIPAGHPPLIAVFPTPAPHLSPLTSSSPLSSPPSPAFLSDAG